MVRRIVQQSAASGVAHVNFGSGPSSRRAESGAGDAQIMPDYSGRWNTDRAGLVAPGSDHDRAPPHDAGMARTLSHGAFLDALSRATGGLDRDAYAARGAVYEREYKSLLRRLYSANPPLTDAEIDAVLSAFRDAVRATEI